MIFWILLFTLVTLLIVSIAIQDEVLAFLAFPVGIAFMCVAVLGGIFASEYKDTRTETHNLQALGVRDSSSGHRYWLGSGYSNGQPGFNYIRESGNDQFVMRFVENDHATIWTDEEEEPYVDITYYEGSNPLWVPWNTRGGWRADFHVPVDSVSTDIVVAP